MTDADCPEAVGGLPRGEEEMGTSSLPDCALTPGTSHHLHQYRDRNHSMKTHRGSRGHLITSLENISLGASASSNMSLRSPMERSVRGINTRQRALISGVINR